MTPQITRRQWLCWIPVAASMASVAGAQTPIADVGIAATAMLPVQSRVYRLQGETDQPVVVTAIAADPRGEFLAASGDDHLIRILSASNLVVVDTLAGHRDVIRTLAFDPSGRKLVSAGNDGQLFVWNRDEKFAVLQKMAGTPALARVRFAPEGTEMAAVGFDNKIYLMGNQRRSRPVLTCDCPDLRAIAYREDNGVIAVAGRSGGLHLFDFQTGHLMSEHPLHDGRIHDVVFHRQSNWAVCVGEDGYVTVFDTGEKQLRHRVNVTSGKLFAAVVLNSQMVAVAGSDNVIRVVDTSTGRIVRTLQGHRGSVQTLASNDEFLISGSFDATLRRWSIADIGPGEQRIAEIDPTVER